MPFDKKRDKQLRNLLPAVKHLLRREYIIQSVDASDALKKKQEYVPEDTDSDNYSLDDDSWGYESED